MSVSSSAWTSCSSSAAERLAATSTSAALRAETGLAGRSGRRRAHPPIPARRSRRARRPRPAAPPPRPGGVRAGRARSSHAVSTPVSPGAADRRPTARAPARRAASRAALERARPRSSSRATAERANTRTREGVKTGARRPRCRPSPLDHLLDPLGRQAAAEDERDVQMRGGQKRRPPAPPSDSPPRCDRVSPTRRRVRDEDEAPGHVAPAEALPATAGCAGTGARRRWPCPLAHRSGHAFDRAEAHVAREAKMPGTVVTSSGPVRGPTPAGRPASGPVRTNPWSSRATSGGCQAVMASRPRR